jgi:UDPglucose--hexose-1-phosphate uridylyltransferase
MATAELRRDVVTGNYVLVNPARSGRPFTVSARRNEHAHTVAGVPDDCPFCWGNEHATAEELVRVGPGAAGEPGWRVRVVRNRYPVLGGSDAETGRCEVVVFRAHDRRLEDLDLDELAEVLAVIRDRVAVHARAGRAVVQVFVNTDWESGASISHPHAQLIALDFVPPALDLEFTMVEAAIADGTGADPLQRDLALAVARGLVVVDDDIAAWCPWEMPNPFGVRIAPGTQGAPFVALGPDDVTALARTLGAVLRSVNDVLERPAYNVVFFGDQARDDLIRRWRVEVVPRINVPGGFEIGTGVTTHATDTAEAARVLRHPMQSTATPAGPARGDGSVTGPAL